MTNRSKESSATSVQSGASIPVPWDVASAAGTASGSGSMLASGVMLVPTPSRLRDSLRGGRTAARLRPFEGHTDDGVVGRRVGPAPVSKGIGEADDRSGQGACEDSYDHGGAGEHRQRALVQSSSSGVSLAGRVAVSSGVSTIRGGADTGGTNFWTAHETEGRREGGARAGAIAGGRSFEVRYLDLTGGSGESRG